MACIGRGFSVEFARPRFGRCGRHTALWRALLGWLWAAVATVVPRPRRRGRSGGGHGISPAIDYRCLDDVVTLLADEAPGLHQALALREQMSVRSFIGPFVPVSAPPRGCMMVARMALRRAPQVRRAAFVDTFNAAEVMTVRPEDKNARQVQQAFADGATLAELEQHLAFLRSLGAPDDAHPKVGVNEDYEVTMMICVVERPTVQAPIAP